MLKELEQLLSEIAKQQGVDIPARRSPPMRREPELAEAVPVEIIDAEPVHEAIGKHVARTVDTSDIAQHASHLGAEVGQADDRLEARIHDKFDHDLGLLNDHAYDDNSTQPKGAGLGDASDIAALLRNPKSVRHALVLNEILNRPVDRW